ncbi:5B protein [uncultured phage MedDCM-OCT-S04-C348]|nr:5B protein [uncultured phage MedDCM-OCT-S04-C348]
MNLSIKTRARKKLVSLFPPIEHEEWFTPKVNNANRGYVKGQPFCKKRIEVFNPGSRQQIVDRLKKKYGWVPESKTDKGNPVLNDDVLEKLPYPEAKPLAEYMLLKKRLGQIKDGNNAWIKLVSPDGYIHGDMVTNGCITGRCSHRNPNTAQIPAGYSPYGKECRSLFHAPDDWILIGSDAKALELRCLAGYLAFWDGGEYGQMVTDDSVDIHTYNQEKFGVETRDISKRLLYAVLYGAGFYKAGTIVDPDEKDPDILKQLGKTAINSFMTGVPALQELKNKLAENLVARGYLLGLDRRPLYCRSDFKALNVLLQSCGAILMKQVVINIHKNLVSAGLVYGQDWHQHGMIHDEIQLSCRPGIEKKSFVLFFLLFQWLEKPLIFSARLKVTLNRIHLVRYALISRHSFDVSPRLLIPLLNHESSFCLRSSC